MLLGRTLLYFAKRHTPEKRTTHPTTPLILSPRTSHQALAALAFFSA